MKVRYDEDIKAYMKENDYRHVVIDQVDTGGCGGGASGLTTSFVSDRHADSLRKRAVRVIEGALGDIVVLARGLEYDDEIALSLAGRPGMEEIAVAGIRA